MCNTCGCKSAENFEAKPYGDYHKRDFYTVAHGKTEEPRFAEVYETFETWDEAYEQANRLSRFTDGEYVFIFSPKDASPYVIEPQNKDYFGAEPTQRGGYGSRGHRNYDCEKGRHRWRDTMNGRRYYPTQDEDGLHIIIEENQQGCQDCGIYKTYRNTYDFKEASFEKPKTYHMTYGSKKGKVVPIYDEKMERYLEETNTPTYHRTFLDDVLRGYGAESKFDELADEIAEQYEKKGKSKEEAEKIGKATAYKVGVAKYGKRGMTNKAKAGIRKKKMGAEGLYECSECKHWNRNPVAGITKCKKCGHGSFNQVKKAETFGAEKMSPCCGEPLIEREGIFCEACGENYGFSAETFEANEEAVEQTDANMVNEGSVEAFYGGGAKVSVSSAGIQPTANPSVDEAFDVGNQVGLDVAEQEIMNENPSVEVNYGAESGQMCEVCFGNDDLPYDSDHFTECRRCGKSVCMDCDGEMQSHPDWFKVCGECSDVLDNVHDYGGEDMSLKDSAKLGFGVGAGLLGFNVALLGIATIGGFLLNRD